MIAKIAVSAATYAIDKPYSYKIPEGMTLQPGQRVQLPFGRANKRTEGVVLTVETGSEEKLKAVERCLDEAPILSEHQLRLAAFLRERYFCTFYECLRVMLPAALKAGVTPVEAKEVVYQATAYLGMGRVFPFLQATNDVLTQEGVTLPLPPPATTTLETRREAGTQSQVEIFGEGMQDFWRSGPEESRHINRWLAANCFGDYYTRTGLDTRQRELITFCFLSAQGGCEPQLTSHAAANLRVGNDKAFLLQVLSQCLPYIGYPRSLNALRCLNDAAEQVK